MSLPKLQASNVVRYRDRKLKARIDPQLPVRQVIKQLSSAFKTEEPAGTLALRDANDNLVTDENLSLKVMEGDDLKIVSSPALEALDTISALSYALQPLSPIPSSPRHQAQPPLKLSLFNLNKYIKEEEFSHEFMLKGGMQLLVKLLSIPKHGGEEGAGMGAGSIGTLTRTNNNSEVLTGNMLAYALQSFVAILELNIGWESISDACIARLVDVVATAKAHNVCRPATDGLIRLLGRVRGEGGVAAKRTKGKGRAIESDEDGRSLGLRPIYPAIHAQALFIPAVVKRVDSSDVEMAARSLELVNCIFHACLAAESGEDLLDNLQSSKINEVVRRAMSVHEHVDINEQIVRFQILYLRFLKLKLQQPGSDSEDHYQASLRMVLAAIDRGQESIVGSSDRQVANLQGNALTDGISVHEEKYDRAGVLSIDLLAWATRQPHSFNKIIDDMNTIEANIRPSLMVASFHCARLLISCFEALSADKTDGYLPALLTFQRTHGLCMRLFFKIWLALEAKMNDLDQVFLATESQMRLVMSEDPLMAWHTLENRILDTSYDEILERQKAMLEQAKAKSHSHSFRSLAQEIERQCQTFRDWQRLGYMQSGTWFQGGINLTTTAPGTPLTDASPSPWYYLRLNSAAGSLLWGTSPSKTTLGAELPFSISFSSILEIRQQTSRPVTATSQAIPSQNSFSLIDTSGTSLLDLVAENNDDHAEWIDGLTALFRANQENEELTPSVDRVTESLVESMLSVRLLSASDDHIMEPDLGLSDVDPTITHIPSSTEFWYGFE